MPLFKPSAKKVVETIFSEFTPEEMKILESDASPFPHMYTTLINHVCPGSRSKYSLDQIKSMARVCIYPCRKHLDNPVVRKEIFTIFTQKIFVG